MAFLQQVLEFIKTHAWIPAYFGVQIVAAILIPLGLPGLWLQALAALAVTLLTDHMGWYWTALIFVLAVAGEVLDQVFGWLGLSAVNASKTSAWFALIGGFVFAFFGGWLGVPIPILGSIIGSLIMSFVGTFVGAIGGEMLHQRRLSPHLHVAFGALLGRVCGISAKLSFAFAAFLIAFVAVLWEFISKAAGR